MPKQRRRAKTSCYRRANPADPAKRDIGNPYQVVFGPLYLFAWKEICITPHQSSHSTIHQTPLTRDAPSPRPHLPPAKPPTLPHPSPHISKARNPPATAPHRTLHRPHNSAHPPRLPQTHNPPAPDPLSGPILQRFHRQSQALVPRALRSMAGNAASWEAESGVSQWQ